MSFQITITGKLTDDPRDRILALEAATRAICEEHGHDPAEGTMMLLTAAAHMHMQYEKPGTDTMQTLAYTLGCALVSAEGFFKLREVKS